MARNRVYVDAPPAAVAGRLAEAENYPRWVVGAAGLRGSDPDFPATGSRFYHRVGLRPFTLSDNTEVLESDLPRRILLKAKGRPLGTARVELVLEPEGDGTRVTMTETPGDSISALFGSNPVADKVLQVRNTESLMRFKRLVERGSEATVRPKGLDDLQGARVLVTGASSGIGLATAIALAEAGSRVALLSRGGDGLDRAAAQVAERGAEPVPLAADVTDRDALSEAFEEAAEALGGIDAVIANAAESAFGPFAETPPELFDETIETVLVGTANTVRTALPHLERSSGPLVVVGSVASKMPLPGMSAYSAAKFGVRGLLATLRIELREAGSPISISMVHPPAVDTSFDHRAVSATGLLPPRPPVMAPERVARAVLSELRDPGGDVTLGAGGRAGAALFGIARPLSEAALRIAARFAQAGGDREAKRSALAGPAGDGTVREQPVG